MTGCQDDVIDFLSRAASYGMPGGAVERIDTHCSIVFLVGDRAYKLKRALRFASLDYTTRALRQQACDAELRLNRRTAPAMYLAVRTITRMDSGGLTFDGPGPAVDHVVEMRRFPQSDLFDALLENGRLTLPMMHELGREIASLHRAAAPTQSYGGSAALRQVIAENDRELARVAAILDGAAVGLLRARTSATLDALAPLLDARRDAGKVRRGHGDLRLANICLYEGHATLFDCIEFSEEIGCIDVLYDLAFLLMDLLVRQRHDLANAVFNAYLDCLPETTGLRALPLFLALRAATRSYALAGSAQRRRTPAEAARQIERARNHIAAGLDFLTPTSPRLVILGGGAADRRGEIAETLAPRLQPAPGARIVSTATAVGSAVAETLGAGCSVLIGTATGTIRGLEPIVSGGACRVAWLWCGDAPRRDGRWHHLPRLQPAALVVADAVAVITKT